MGVTNFSFMKLSEFNISTMEYSKTVNEVFLKANFPLYYTVLPKMANLEK